MIGSKQKVRKALYYHYYEYPMPHVVKRDYGISNERYKLTPFYDDIDEWELYDLKNDPKEMKNQFNNPRFAKIKQRLVRDLLKL